MVTLKMEAERMPKDSRNVFNNCHIEIKEEDLVQEAEACHLSTKNLNLFSLVWMVSLVRTMCLAKSEEDKRKFKMLDGV